MTSARNAPPEVLKPLVDLLAEVPGLLSWPPPPIQVAGVTGDSRDVRPGYLFVARAGDVYDGHVFIPDAVMSGAAAVIGEQPATEVHAPVPYLRVRDGREALAWLSAAWYDFPARRLATIGITGTDGKTTTVNLLHHILTAAGLKTGMLSTVRAVIGTDEFDVGLHVTTPEAPDVQRYLAKMVAAGTSHAIVEATSHGLAQHRVSACEFDVAIVTNLSHEHLDYHGDWAGYLEAKSRLVEGLQTAEQKPGVPKLAVLNKDDPTFEHFLDMAPEHVISYALQANAAVTARDIVQTSNATRFTLQIRLPAGLPQSQPLDGEIPISTSLIGIYNVYNIVAAAAAALGLGVAPQAIREGVAAMPGIPGRMERLSDAQHRFLAIVDFAHTPNALEKVLKTARTLTVGEGRVIAVWGSAGLRDREKRRLMGDVSARWADIIIITAEDPRTESLEDIMAQSAAACEAAGRREGSDFWRVADRGQAIRRAVEMARGGDVVIACGKGHEQSMCFGTTEYPWDDREAMRLALRGKTLDTLPTSPNFAGKKKGGVP
jgi:UDP-N-acetylmuramoyl-L-alanyl-D-glutamate--2,6-diaminopimelate ligase